MRSFAKLLLWISASLFCCASASAQTATLSGVALDINGNPVAGATVTVCPAATSGIPCGNPLQVTQSAGNGAWIVYINSGTYTVTVNRGGLVSTTQQLTTGALPAQSIPNGVSTPSLNSIIFVDGVTYKTPQAAISASPAGARIWVPTGTWAQGSTPITLTAHELHCDPGALITFTGLGSTTDAVTMGWSNDETQGRTGIDGCNFRVTDNSGQDGIRSNGGNHWYVRNVTFNGYGRDGFHLEPDVSLHWSENSVVDNLHLDANSTPGVSSVSANLRDGINISMSNSALTGVYINEGVWRTVNIRGYKRHAIHFLDNDSCAGCKISSHTFTDVHSDGVGNQPGTNNAVFFEKGASCCTGPTNPIEATAFNGGGGFEDTVITPSAAAISIGASGLVNTVDVLSSINGNFGGGVFDQNAVTNSFGGVTRIGVGVNQIYGCWNWVSVTNIAVQIPACIDSNNYLKFSAGGGLRYSQNGTSEWRLNNVSNTDNEMQFWKDATPTFAFALGLNVPGGSLGNDLVFSAFSGSWLERLRNPTSGGTAWLEQAAPTNAGAGYDHCYGDSTLHALKCSYNNGTFFQIPQVLTATSSAFATATTAGTCVQNTTAVPNATTAMAVSISPTSTPGVGAVWSAFVSSAGNVTINECAVATSAGGTIAFNIRVTP